MNCEVSNNLMHLIFDCCLDFVNLLDFDCMLISYIHFLELLEGEEEHAIERGESTDIWYETAIKCSYSMLHVNLFQKLDRAILVAELGIHDDGGEDIDGRPDDTGCQAGQTCAHEVTRHSIAQQIGLDHKLLVLVVRGKFSRIDY